MFETLQPSRPEPVKNWVSTTLYGVYCAIGAFGLFGSLWKHHGSSRSLGLVCYAVVFVLALYFIVAARTNRPTLRGVSTRCLIMLWLSLGPTFLGLWNLSYK
jgi:hypothetical protein